MEIKIRAISPLEKVFYDDRIEKFRAYPRSSALLGERHSFCVAYAAQSDAPNAYPRMTLRAVADVKKNGRPDAKSAKYVTVSAIEHVPSVFPAVLSSEPDDTLRSRPGLFPDLLIPLAGGDPLYVLPQITGSLWVDIDTAKAGAGDFEINVRLENEKGETLAAAEHAVHIVDAALPPQKLAVTHWLHTDCLVDFYGFKAFSRAYWNAVGNLIDKAVKNGTNVIYTPLFTPPLDTAVGGERTTVQLIDVTETRKGVYRFGFEKLEKWVEIAKKHGAAYFEMSHLFTQWGAFHAPKIYVRRRDGACEKRFGWDTDSHGEAYESFLSQFLPALDKELKKLGIAEVTFFHISDEPSLEHLESYSACRAIVKKYLKGYPTLDAMGKIEFYDKGLVDIPVPFICHADPFFKKNIRPRWCYYCGTSKDHMARSFALPSCRNRLSGVMFYAFDVDGFLHWGFNFYNSVRSVRHIDPYFITDSDKGFCSGDAFLVYPAPGGRFYDSIRLAVFKEGVDDMRALQLCESLYGRDAVTAMLTKKNGGTPLSFHGLPKDKTYLLKVRETVNRMIEKAVKR